MISKNDLVIRELLENIKRSSQQLKKVLLNLSIVTGKLRSPFLQDGQAILRTLRGGWLWRLTNSTKHNLLKMEQVKSELNSYIRGLFEKLESKGKRIKEGTCLGQIRNSWEKQEVRVYHAAILEFLSPDDGKIVNNPRISKKEIEQLHDQVTSYITVVSEINENARKLYYHFKSNNMKTLLELKP